jgi:hypothetical protein
MDKKYDLMQSTGTYQKDGMEKSRWTKIGIMLEKADGKRSIKLEVLPLPSKEGEVWLQVFENKPKAEGW